ncbi:hypothetical protein KR51_00031970 [Rubidibacter lacunae KORDI 51-2]|uniref:DUF4398 domain-containing protein n=1 Tax=Rubidibacter lacunae KORDI 51-2 TaxID=582515 RepID=U5DKL3_9CHRO|nr:hypothetical protein [Rubidibacter lacunae]ERN40255.1 hypothetical protein KR51_00031970 [Rubidibacter lacunae KORDI 51-2]
MAGLRYFGWQAIAGSFILGGTLGSCAPTRYAQCSEMFAIANTAVTEARALTDDGQTDNPQAMLQAADTMEAAAQDMETLKLADAQLQAYRADFANMYRQTSESTRAFVKAREEFDREAAEDAKDRLERATAGEPQLVSNINTYCDSDDSGS